MLRSTATRALLAPSRAAVTPSPFIASRFSSTLSSATNGTRQLAVRRPLALSLLQQPQRRYVSDKFLKDSKPLVGEVASKDVSGESSVRHILSEQGDAAGKVTINPSTKSVHSKGALASDFETIKETFALRSVPREAYVLGLAGLLPYTATAGATILTAFDVNYAHEHGSGLFLSAETAQYVLETLQPIQVGYGAVILSFLGAIHWGLEWAEYGGKHGYRRYAIGVLAPAIAWPTILMPYNYALISQFLGFTALYYADSTVTNKGWTPPWYGTYRFVLTFIAGASIIFTLVGVGEVSDKLERSRKSLGTKPDPTDKVRKEDSGTSEEIHYQEEKARILDAKQKKEEEEKKQKEEEEKKKESKDNKDKKSNPAANNEKTNKKEEASGKSDSAKDKAQEGVEKTREGGEGQNQGNKEKGKGGGTEGNKTDQGDDRTVIKASGTADKKDQQK